VIKKGHMKLTKRNRRMFTREFKIAAVRRVQAGERVTVVAREIKVATAQLCRWKARVERFGENSLYELSRPWKKEESPETDEGQKARIAELERLVGRQQAAIDFLERALHRVEETRQQLSGSGVTASSK